MRLNGVGEFVALVDVDPDATGCDVVEQGFGKLGPLGRIGNIVGERRAREIDRALDGKLQRIDRRKWPRRRAAPDQHPPSLQGFQRPLVCVLADCVVYRRDALAVRQLADSLDDILAAVEDDLVATMGLGQFGLGLGRNRADDAQPQELGPLRGDQVSLEALRRFICWNKLFIAP